MERPVKPGPINEALWQECLKVVPKERITDDQCPLECGVVDGNKVVMVDGDEVLVKYDMDFVQGANDLELKDRYNGKPYIPPATIWLDCDIPVPDYAFVCYHEAMERRLMQDKGMHYNEAHDQTCQSEKALRIREGYTGSQRTTEWVIIHSQAPEDFDGLFDASLQEALTAYHFSERQVGRAGLPNDATDKEIADEHGITHVIDVHHQGKNVGYLAIADSPQGAHFDALYVKPEHRKFGVADELLRRGIGKFGQKPITLHVMPYKDKHLDSTKLERYYGRFGFKPHGEKGYMMARMPAHKIPTQEAGDVKKAIGGAVLGSAIAAGGPLAVGLHQMHQQNVQHGAPTEAVSRGEARGMHEPGDKVTVLNPGNPIWGGGSHTLTHDHALEHGHPLAAEGYKRAADFARQTAHVDNAAMIPARDYMNIRLTSAPKFESIDATDERVAELKALIEANEMIPNGETREWWRGYIQDRPNSPTDSEMRRNGRNARLVSDQRRREVGGSTVRPQLVTAAGEVPRHKDWDLSPNGVAQHQLKHPEFRGVEKYDPRATDAHVHPVQAHVAKLRDAAAHAREHGHEEAANFYLDQAAKHEDLFHGVKPTVSPWVVVGRPPPLKARHATGSTAPRGWTSTEAVDERVAELGVLLEENTDMIDPRVAELKALLEGEKYQYASCLFDIPDDVAKKIKDLQGKIDKDHLCEDGLEKKYHLTVLYGLYGLGDKEALKNLVGKFGPVLCRLGKTSCFPATLEKPYDCLKVEVESVPLMALNKLVRAGRPHSIAQNEYCPHITIAKLKPGIGEKYIGRCALDGQEVIFDKLVYSDMDGTRSTFTLGDPLPQREIHNYKLADNPKRSCATCEYFSKSKGTAGKCKKFKTQVNQEMVCDSWEQKPGMVEQLAMVMPKGESLANLLEMAADKRVSEIRYFMESEQRAPKGHPVTIGGKEYKPGEWIPSDVASSKEGKEALDKAYAEERKEMKQKRGKENETRKEKAQTKAKAENSPEKDRGREDRAELEKKQREENKAKDDEEKAEKKRQEMADFIARYHATYEKERVANPEGEAEADKKAQALEKAGKELPKNDISLNPGQFRDLYAFAHTKAHRLVHEIEVDAGKPVKQADRLTRALSVVDHFLGLGTIAAALATIPKLSGPLGSRIEQALKMSSAAMAPWASLAYITMHPVKTLFGRKKTVKQKLLSPVDMAVAAGRVVGDMQSRVVPERQAERRVLHVGRGRKYEPGEQGEQGRRGAPGKYKVGGTFHGQEILGFVHKQDGTRDYNRLKVKDAETGEPKVVRIPTIKKRQAKAELRQQVADRQAQAQRRQHESLDFEDPRVLGLADLLEEEEDVHLDESDLSTLDIDDASLLVNAIDQHQDDWYPVLLITAYARTGDMELAVKIADLAFRAMPEPPMAEEEPEENPEPAMP